MFELTCFRLIFLLRCLTWRYLFRPECPSTSSTSAGDSSAGGSATTPAAPLAPATATEARADAPEARAKALVAKVAAPVAEAVPAAATEASARALTKEGAAEECGGRCFGDVDHWSCFQPLDELVDGDVEVPVPTDGPRERSQDIQSLYSERPRGWYHLQSLSWCVSDLHGTGMLCRTLPAQLYPRVLSACKNHAGRPFRPTCRMKNDFRTCLHGSL